jgi:hypothetical protein
MKLFRWVAREVQEVDDIVCNRCGKTTSTAAGYGGFEAATLSARWGYGSRKDTQVHEAHLCETCYDAVIETFEHPPEISKDELT